MDVQGLQSFVLNKLHDQLPNWLTYHNAAHTEKVIVHAIEIGENENLSKEEIALLHTAAVMHDAGFLTTYADHEKASCKLSREILPGYNYSYAQVEDVCTIIMATQLPQSPLNKLSNILCDADLYYLGTDDYKVFANRLFCELKHQNKELSNKAWINIQYNFLKTHTYFTATAKNRLEHKKEQNLQNFIRQHKDFVVANAGRMQ